MLEMQLEMYKEAFMAFIHLYYTLFIIGDFEQLIFNSRQESADLVCCLVHPKLPIFVKINKYLIMFNCFITSAFG